jgi:hypothetical protein
MGWAIGGAMRKVKDVTISEGSTADNRDYGKVFRITELPATEIEKWGMRMVLLAIKTGVEVPDGIRAVGGMRAVAAMGIQTLMSGGINFREVEPLLDEMFHCIQAVPDPRKPDIVRKLVEEDIEEWSTRLALRSEWFQLHVGFSIGESASNSTGTSSIASPGSPNQPTSPQPSPQPAPRIPAFMRGSRPISR